MNRALGRAAASPRIFVLAALLFVVGTVGGTAAEFSAESQHAATFAGGWIGAPGGLSVPTVRGNGAMLSWTTPATHGATSQAVYGTNFGTTRPANCSTATYATSFVTGLGTAAVTATADRGGGDGGDWICYQVRGVHGSWYSGASFSGPLQVGLVPLSLSVGDTGNSKFDQGDSVGVTYNQNVTYTGNVVVCTFTNGTLLLGDTTTGNASCGAATDTPTIGKITGLTIGSANSCAATAVAGSGTTTLTVTAGSCGAGNNGRVSISGSGTLDGSGSAPLSSAGSAAACTVSGCLPSTSFTVFQ